MSVVIKIVLDMLDWPNKDGQRFRYSQEVRLRTVVSFKVIVLNTGIFWLFRTCSASFDHLIGEKTRMYFAKSLSDSIMNSYSLLPNITILIMQSTSMALQRI